MLRHIQILFLLFGLSECWTPVSNAADKPSRPFAFGRDTIAFPNELKWEYSFDDKGLLKTHKRTPPASYSLHCFVLARTAAQFYQFAEFHPELPKTNSAAYKNLIQQLCRANLRKQAKGPIIIPGYTNLHELSEAQESILKTCAGGVSQSYFQRGNWRLVFPFSRTNQERTCDRLKKTIQEKGEAVIHVVHFPKQDINHAILAYRFEDRPTQVLFSFYDPNDPSMPHDLVYDRATRRFTFPRTHYFPGGPVNVYQIYRSCFY